MGFPLYPRAIKSVDGCAVQGAVSRIEVGKKMLTSK